MSRSREKDSTADYRTLNISALKRDNCLAPGQSFDWSWWRRDEKVASIGIEIESRHTVRLRYQSTRYGGDPVHHNYTVALDWTPCHLGGERPWFRCPSCRHRVAKLYGAAVFICRQCLRLNYPSQQSNKRDRPIDRAWELRRRLGCDAGPFDYPAKYIKRPKGMHRRTFSKRIEQLAAIEEQALAIYDEMVERIAGTKTRKKLEL